MRLPKTPVDMLVALGLYETELRSLDQVRKAQRLLAAFLVEAAEEACPDFYLLTDAERLPLLWETGCKRWDHLPGLCTALVDAERSLILQSEAMA